MSHEAPAPLVSVPRVRRRRTPGEKLRDALLVLTGGTARVESHALTTRSTTSLISSSLIYFSATLKLVFSIDSQSVSPRCPMVSAFKLFTNNFSLKSTVEAILSLMNFLTVPSTAFSNFGAAMFNALLPTFIKEETDTKKEEEEK